MTEVRRAVRVMIVFHRLGLTSPRRFRSSSASSSCASFVCSTLIRSVCNCPIELMPSGSGAIAIAFSTRI